MRKIRALIGMPVVVGNRRVGRVIQAELSEDLTRLDGLWMDAGLRGTRFIPSEQLEMLGRVAVMADDMGRRGRMRAEPLFRRAIGTDGRRLGAVTGAEVDELTFSVRALELSRGLWEDLARGRDRIRTFTLNRENGDVVVDVAESEKEGLDDEERNGKGPDHGCRDRRLGGDDVRHHELAERQEDEPAVQKDGPLDRGQDR